MPQPTETEFGERAREARLRLGLKQADVAERIGISNEVYGRIERGIVVPRLPTVRRLCEVLGVQPNDLIVGHVLPPHRNDGTSSEMRQLAAVLDGADATTMKRITEIARWLRSPQGPPPKTRGAPRRGRKRSRRA